MDNDFFMNQSSVATWQTMNDMNWDNSLGHTVVQYESALSSMVSSPVASNSNMTNDCFVIRELIGKLGNINKPGEISPHSRSPVLINSGTTPVSASYIGGSNSTNTSCYNTPLNSPPKLSLPIMDHMVRDKIPKLGHLAHSMALNSSVAEFSADPGFAERAARFSCFGSRSFNGRTTQLGVSDAELGVRSNSNHLLANANIRLPRVSSSPSLKALGSQVKLQQNMNSPLQGRVELANSQEESSVSEQFPSLDVNARNDMLSRKRKAIPKGKAKETSNPSNAGKVSEMNENPNSKRSKQDGNNGNENSPAKPEEESNKAEEKKPESETKPPEPPRDYIHVRARRGQATDSHSLAERVRRERISERMKLLQDLVPGCSKVTGKALMLDEIINYVQSLQRQVEFLSMKLASVNTSMDFNMDAVMPKDMYQPNSSVGHLMFPTDSSTSSFHGQLNQTLHLHGHIPDGTVTPCSLDPLNVSTSGNFESQLPPLNELQYQKFCGDDLQRIVQMGFSNNLHQETPFHMQTYHGSNQVSNTKIEH